MNEKKLGQWLFDQRKLYLKSSMKIERRGMFLRLMEKGMIDWRTTAKAEKRNSRWDVYFQALIRYGQINSDCNVPRSFEMEFELNGINERLLLGKWLHNQRSKHSAGRLDANKVRE
jgi:hypothetical protein